MQPAAADIKNLIDCQYVVMTAIAPQSSSIGWFEISTTIIYSLYYYKTLIITSKIVFQQQSIDAIYLFAYMRNQSKFFSWLKNVY